MNQESYDDMREDFARRCDLVRLDAYAETGYEWMVVPKTGANRTIKAQNLLFHQPDDGIDNDHDGLVDERDELVTKAKGGQSPHNFDLARDIVPMIHKGVIWWEAPKGLWKIMADIAVRHGLVSGYYFNSIFDAPHVEYAEWKQAQAAWREGEINVV